MTEIIKALQEEIEAAQKMRRDMRVINGDYRDLVGYIRGLQTAVKLLTAQPVEELGY